MFSEEEGRLVISSSTERRELRDLVAGKAWYTCNVNSRDVLVTSPASAERCGHSRCIVPFTWKGISGSASAGPLRGLCKLAHEVRVVPERPPRRPRRRRLSGGIRERVSSLLLSRISRQCNHAPRPTSGKALGAWRTARRPCSPSRDKDDAERDRKGLKNIEIAIITGGTDHKPCNTVVGRRYGLPTGAYRYTQALCRREVEYGLYWRHLLHG
ncbi:LOW QUALITY PROTEIN: uncharacterized protein LOC143371079 [Andrena cerasifolii]|uniref:LOW QUALITY PROTEIN: uncharacterized protein LOC143371079 n=1 Tax=Andrena cerasifolii TaxID=2819439 RepID=UPI004037B494